MMQVQRNQHLVLVRPDPQRRQAHLVRLGIGISHSIADVPTSSNTATTAALRQQRTQRGAHPRDQLPEQADKLQCLGAAGPRAAHRKPVRIDAHAVQHTALLPDQTETGVGVAFALLGDGRSM